MDHDHAHHDCAHAHDQAARAPAALAAAEECCARRGEKLTPLRRSVLAALYASHRPVSAYDLIERIAADTMLIADQPPPLTPDGKVDNGAVQAMRLQVDTRKWLLSKLAPKRYGERVALAADEESPLQVGINVNFVKPNGGS